MIHPRFLGKYTQVYLHLIKQKRFIDWPILAYYIYIGISAELCFVSVHILVLNMFLGFIDSNVGHLKMLFKVCGAADLNEFFDQRRCSCM